MSEFIWTGNGIEGPEQVASGSIISFYPSTNAQFTTRKTGNDHAIKIQWCTGYGVSL